MGTSPPKNLIAGIITNQEKTPPAKMVPATRGPMMYPTPEVLGRDVGAQRGPGDAAGRYSGVLFSDRERVLVLEQGVDAPQPRGR